MEGITPNSCTKTMVEKKARPPQEQVNCPRCNSTNTKFCYYNNYSLTQPRYFCKTCRRYWTEGGSLRNIPVGGGSRKNKRVMINSSSSSSSSSSTTTSSKVLPDFKLNDPPTSSQNMKGHDLNLAFPATESYYGMSPYVPSFMMQSSNAVYPSGFPMQEIIKPNIGFSIDGVVQDNNGGGGNGNGNGTLLFPFGDMKQLSTSVEVEHHKEQGNSTGFNWTGIIGDQGSSW